MDLNFHSIPQTMVGVIKTDNHSQKESETLKQEVGASRKNKGKWMLY